MTSAESIGTVRELKPLAITQVEGPGFTVDDGLLDVVVIARFWGTAPALVSAATGLGTGARAQDVAADLGIRLYKRGYQTAIIDSTTYEEANSKLGNWIRQRSRWIKGYMQTWLVHNRNPLRLLRIARAANITSE